MTAPRKFAPFKAFAAAAVGALGFGGMSAAGYTPGSETNIGLDGSTIRDTVTGALTIGSLFVPALGPVANVVKSLTNHREVEAVTKETAAQNARERVQNERLDELEVRVSKLEKRK
jgi:hypothetical protein